mmetsp:Transcript_31187/g.103761  ORF Transcript_31187/g.103761 Transcript_31187/m.103761 type:complete len:347 (+) Transcript_31187:56-1096(+)|eukprot:CAMPEP_0203870836 /NCGR_PEP_ID=MMETSP0359-20131031/18436_1 /ASSEMBLY_ACC=CAM_ASM_000338 /TAXON_ID=268821 /ORGANISM="Scrippsiella Hangoei, Strain SHTV-5" /LENGTH=346 /DNA_ID=CAMNT_0050789507 /DNA_START=56 /DNA_END=1096 /DNA_ORIENTATION=-
MSPIGCPRKAFCSKFAILLALGYAPRWTSAFSHSEAAWLADNDECAGSSQSCALGMLQLRGSGTSASVVAEASSAVGARSKRSRRPRIVDLNPLVERQLLTKIVAVRDNITQMEWKLYWIAKDVESANGTLNGEANNTIGIGANGTVVNWTDHADTWYPDLKPDLAMLSDMAVSRKEATASSRRRHGKAPPRQKRVQKFMSAQQHRLDFLWKSMTETERHINNMGAYMNEHRRVYNHSEIVNQSAEEATTTGGNGTLRSHKRKCFQWSCDDNGDDDNEKPKKPEEVIEDQLKSADKQLEDMWEGLGKLGVLLEEVKRRVALYAKSTSAGRSEGEEADADELEDEPE